MGWDPQCRAKPLPWVCHPPALTRMHFPGSRLQTEPSVLTLWVNFPSIRTRSPFSSSTATRMELLPRATETCDRAEENHFMCEGGDLGMLWEGTMVPKAPGQGPQDKTQDILESPGIRNKKIGTWSL